MANNTLANFMRFVKGGSNAAESAFRKANPLAPAGAVAIKDGRYVDSKGFPLSTRGANANEKALVPTEGAGPSVMAQYIKKIDPNAPAGAAKILPNGRYATEDGFPLSVRGPNGRNVEAFASQEIIDQAKVAGSRFQTIIDRGRTQSPSVDVVPTVRPSRDSYQPNWVEYRNTLPVPRNSTDLSGISSTSGFFPRSPSNSAPRPGPSASPGGLPSVIQSMPHGQSAPPFIRGQGDPGFRTGGLQRNALGNLAVQNMLQSQLHPSATSATAGSTPPTGPETPTEREVALEGQPPIESARPRLELGPDDVDGFRLTPDAEDKRVDPVIQQAINSARQVVAREPAPAPRERETVYWGDPDRASDFFRGSKEMQRNIKEDRPFVGRSGLPSDPENMKRGGTAKNGMNRDAVVHKALEIIHHMLMRGH